MKKELIILKATIFLVLSFIYNLLSAEISLVKRDTVIYKQINDINLKLWVYQPEKSHKERDNPAIVFFHGGGWRGGGLMQFDQHARYFNSRGLTCFLAEYRVSSKHGTTPFEAVEDAKSAIRFIRKNASEFGIDPDRIAAGGGSAGGHLAAAAGNIEGLENPDEDLTVSSQPNALILFNPVFDNGPDGYGYDRIGERYTEISPIHNIGKETPPTVIFLGDRDKLVPVSTAESYKQKVEDAGSLCELYIYEDQEHAFFNYKNLKYYKATVFRADQFLQKIGYVEGEPTILNDKSDPGNEMTFRERIKPVPRNSGFKMEGYYIWGGSVIKSGDTWHMFASRWPAIRPFPKDYFEMSEIVWATSDNPLGPFEFREVIIGERDSMYWDANMAHNPTIHKIGDTFVLFYLGSDFSTLREGSTHRLRRIGYATAKNIEGPWKRSDQPLFNEESNNPAVFVEEDNSILMMYRNETLRVKVATADNFRGPYTVKNDDVWPVEKIEDFYLFKKNNRYHCILEDNKAQVTGHIRWGGHLVSDDGINNWKEYQPDIVYDHTLVYDDGSILKCDRRERPQLYIEDGKVKYLYTGVYDGESTWCQPVELNPPYPVDEVKELKGTATVIDY